VALSDFARIHGPKEPETTMATTTKPTEKSKPKTDKPAPNGGGWTELPEPIIVEAYWALEEGNSIEGVVLGFRESERENSSDTWQIRADKPTRCKQRDVEGTKMVPAGTVVGVNDNAKLRQLHAHLKKGPIAVRILVGERRVGGRGYEMTVQVRPAF
jgi:hypothetical protein